MLEGGKAQAPPAVHGSDQHREVAEHLVPARAQIREPAKLGIEEAEVVLGVRMQRGSLDGLGTIEEGPLPGFVLEPFLDRFEFPARSRQRVVGCTFGRRVRSQILLTHSRDELVLRCRRAERLAREAERLVDDGLLLELELRPRPRPPLVLFRVENGAIVGCGRSALHRCLQRARRLAAGAVDPEGLLLAPRHRQNRLGRTEWDFARPDRRAKHRPLA